MASTANLIFALLLLKTSAVAGASVMRVHSNGGVEKMQTESANDLTGTFSDDLGATLTARKTYRPHDLLHELEAMTRSGVKVDPDKLSTIKTLVDDDLIPALIATHQKAQAQVNRNIEEIKLCNDETSEKLIEIENTTERDVDQKRQTHIVARTEEKALIEDRNGKCTILTEFVQSIVEPASLPDKSNEAAVVDYVATMARYFCPKEQEAIDKEKSCVDARTVASDKQNECQQFQFSFESSFCTWRTQLIDLRGIQDSCYAQAVKTYSDYKTDTEELVIKWKTEHNALKKISCYVDVWLNDNNASTVDSERLQECKDLEAEPGSAFLLADEECATDKQITSAAMCEQAAKDLGITWNSCCQHISNERYGCTHRTPDGDILFNGNTESTKTLTDRNDRKAVCSTAALDHVMDIDFGEIPPKVIVSLVKVEKYPGTPEFKATEYAYFLDQISEPITCVTQPAPAPAPEAQEM